MLLPPRKRVSQNVDLIGCIDGWMDGHTVITFITFISLEGCAEKKHIVMINVVFTGEGKNQYSIDTNKEWEEYRNLKK